ncbi:hypothetical protein LTS08_006813 [Lithohypha guttulata]|nr:hypothetical protein LTS08_006813 [Lithohypha guttulata]
MARHAASSEILHELEDQTNQCRASEPAQPPPPDYSAIDTDQKTQHERRVPLSQSRNASSSATMNVIHQSAAIRRLQKPIAIPATTPAPGSSFLRAYPPSLESYQISRSRFLHFLDEVNRVAVEFRSLEPLNLAETIRDFVYTTAETVGTAVHSAISAGGTTSGHDEGRTEVFLRMANEEMFNPKGLKCEIATTEVVVQVAGVPARLNSYGRLSRHQTLLRPLEYVESGDVPAVCGQQRRLDALEGYIAPLEMTPSSLSEYGASGSSNGLSDWSRSEIERQRRRGEQRIVEKRTDGMGKSSEKRTKAERKYHEEMAKLDHKLEKAGRKEKDSKLQKELAKTEEKRMALRKEYDADTADVNKNGARDDREERDMRRILWLLICEIETHDRHPYELES